MKAWLLRIQTNTFINRYRRGGLERAVLDGPDADPLSDGWISAATLRSMRDPEGAALRPVLEKEIQRAVEGLPEEFRLAVVLADIEGLGYKEIADVMGCPIGTVMSRLHRGRKLLKGQLIDQARAMGIVGPEAEVGAPKKAAPVNLDSYRERKRSHG
jgi:RNA polymerase sigma-70 factor (ECF subfamily)